jgi:soluble lytic murein transglycosylase-like protein
MPRGSTAFDSIIADAANAWDVPQSLIKAIVEKESGFDPNAYRAEPQIGDASRGLMQLLYGTAQSLGFAGDASDLFDPTTNIRLGTRYLADLTKTAARYGYGIDSAISAYNAGFSSQRAGDGKRTGDTTATPFINQSYVDGVIAAANAYAAQATATPQQLPTVTTIAAPRANAPSGLSLQSVVLQLLVGFAVVLIVNHFTRN